MKLIKVKTTDANVQKIVKPLEGARQSLLSATSQLAVFISRTKMISSLFEEEEAEEYLQDLERSLQSLNKNLVKAKQSLKGVGE